jgi:RNA polymerase sigma-70 factor (ECF subfamily)
MDEQNLLARQFDADRPHLRQVAYRMLGSLAEADDAVQEAWLRLSRSQAGEIGNLTGWLTTVVARIALDMLRARKSRREEGDALVVEQPANDRSSDPAYETELADSVGLAMLVVLQALEPAERVAFVLHDMFDLPFEEIGAIVGRSAAAARQLASRARRRVRGTPEQPDIDLSEQRKVVDAFLAASRDGDFEGLMRLLDPNIVLTGDAAAVRMGGPRRMSGSAAVAKAFQGRAQTARPVLVDGVMGAVVAPQGRLLLVLSMTVKDGRISQIEAIADPARLVQLELAAP